MAQYANLIATITDAIKTNGVGAINGQSLQTILHGMVNSLGLNYQYAGIATPGTNPGAPDQNVFYIASTAGTYTNFGGIVLADGEIAILKYNGAWSKDSTGAATQESVNQLGQEMSVIKELNSIEKENYFINSSNVVSITETIKSILFPFNGRHILDIESSGQIKVFQLTGKPTIGSAAPLCSGTAGVSIENTNGRIITSDDIRFISVNVTENASFVSFKIDGTYNFVDGFIDMPSKGYVNSYFIDAKDCNNRIKELYLTGLNSNEHYRIANLSMYNGSLYLSIVDSSNTIVARVLHSGNTKDIVAVEQRNNSGINGYAIIDIFDSDVTTTVGDSLFVSGELNQDVVACLDNSPSIKQFVLFGSFSLQNLANVLGSDLVDLSGSITWIAGYHQVYHYGQADESFPQDMRIGAASGNYVNHKYSTPIPLKRGDIIIYSGSNLRTIPATACVCETDSVGSYYRGILNLVYLGITATNYYRFVADRDMYVSCNIVFNDSTNFKWYRSQSLADVIDNLHERTPFYLRDEIIDILQQGNQPEYLDSNNTSQGYIAGEIGNQTPQLCLLWFSDVHNDYTRINRLLRFRDKYNNLINDIIFTGDLTGSRYSNFRTEILGLPGFDSVLRAIGNHDVYDANGDAPSGSYSNYAYWATPQQKYSRYMQGKADAESLRNDISTWGVIQPSGAGEGDYYPCYYYKDYDSQKVRLIVIDVMDRPDNAGENPVEVAWFINALAGARTLGYHVIVASHFAPRTSYEGSLKFDCGFTCITDMQYGTIGTNIAAYTEAVDDFIEDGGIFVTWLCGHMHYDQVGTMVNHPKQLYMVISLANQTYVNDHRSRQVGVGSEDLFNFVAVDTFMKHIRVARIGSKFNRYLQHAGTMCISYDASGDKVPHLLSSW